MKNNLIHRVVILASFVISLFFFVIQITLDYDFLDATYNSVCVMLASSIILLFALQFVVKVLIEHLCEQQEKKLAHVEAAPVPEPDEHSNQGSVARRANREIVQPQVPQEGLEESEDVLEAQAEVHGGDSDIQLNDEFENDKFENGDQL